MTGLMTGLLWTLACTGPRCGVSSLPVEGDVYGRLRERMVTTQIEARGIRDPAVLKAMRSVERHRFVPEADRERAYEDHAMPIGLGQTISQPYVVAAMSEALELEPGMKVLEIGTGSGYQAAVLAEIGARVHSIEIVPELARRSAALLADLGYGSVKVVEGDGYLGLPDEAPFDRVIITAAPPETPQAPLEQLVEGGRMVLPVGEHRQDLIVLKKTPSGVVRRDLFRVRFVPMVRGKGD